MLCVPPTARLVDVDARWTLARVNKLSDEVSLENEHDYFVVLHQNMVLSGLGKGCDKLQVAHLVHFDLAISSHYEKVTADSKNFDLFCTDLNL